MILNSLISTNTVTLIEIDHYSEKLLITFADIPLAVCVVMVVMRGGRGGEGGSTCGTHRVLGCCHISDTVY